MPIEILVPRLGWSMDEGTFAEWLRKDGKFVKKGDMLFVLEGDKAAQEIESFDEGTLKLLPCSPKPGDVVLVGQLLGHLLLPHEVGSTADQNVPTAPPAAASTVTAASVTTTSATGVPSSPEASKAVTVSAAVTAPNAVTVSGAGAVSGIADQLFASPSIRRLARELHVDLAGVTGTGPGGRISEEDVRLAASAGSAVSESGMVHATPRARRRAHELGIDWTQLTGSGRAGRIRERDVAAVQGGEAASGAPLPSVTQQKPVLINVTAASAPETPPAAISAPPVVSDPDPVSTASEVPVAAGAKDGAATPVSHRRTIAARMIEAHLNTAPVTLVTTVDVTNLVCLREQFRATTASSVQALPSYTDFVIRLAAIALRSHPHVNARWDGSQVQLQDGVHIGVAVDTDAGLVVPVIRDADSLTLRQLAQNSRDLIERARRKRLTAAQMQGGTFTVTNLGALDIDAFTPIINLPQCAILGMGRIRRMPVYQEQQLVPRDQMTLSLTFDHRIIDGAPAARFLQSLSRSIENPAEFLIG